jgi:hypothetical protein
MRVVREVEVQSTGTSACRGVRRGRSLSVNAASARAPRRRDGVRRGSGCPWSHFWNFSNRISRSEADNAVRIINLPTSPLFVS